MFMTMPDESIDEIGFATSCRTGQEYIVAHGQYVEGLILIHDTKCSEKYKKDNRNCENSPTYFVDSSIIFSKILLISKLAHI